MPGPLVAEHRAGPGVLLEHEVQVGAADAAVRHLDQRLVAARARGRRARAPRSRRRRRRPPRASRSGARGELIRRGWTADRAAQGEQGDEHDDAELERHRQVPAPPGEPGLSGG